MADKIDMTPELTLTPDTAAATAAAVPEAPALMLDMTSAAEEAKAAKAQKKKTTTSEAGRVGDRPYARGRSYKADRYDAE